ncbi:MAG TPA: hypothetical protein VLN47_04840 [Clostridiaceae bacterium]|nr:hypothetical protein [Clostridiaceae bacterium]
MRIEEFETHIRKMAMQIDDVRAKKEIVVELREHLMESYDRERDGGADHDLAVRTVLDRFGEAEGIGADLDKVHTPRLKPRHLLIILTAVILFVTLVYAYFYFTLRITT